MVSADWIEMNCYRGGAAAQPGGRLRLEPAGRRRDETFWRRGLFISEDGGEVPLSIGHSAAASRFLYLRDSTIPEVLAEWIRLSPEDADDDRLVALPGQLLFGAERTATVAKGVASLLAAPDLQLEMRSARSQNTAIFPVLREGIQYGVAAALFENFGIIAPEVIVDSHHIPDPTVRNYGRRAEVSLFKDSDWAAEDRSSVRTAFVCDSVAGGIVLLSVLEAVVRHFPKIERIEVIAPLLTVHGLARIAATAKAFPPIRIHCFETLLNALPPHFYDSPHFPEDDWHAAPGAFRAYREWWGQNDNGDWIADSVCAGVGWSEAFFTPRRQLRMLEDQLQRRHGKSLAEILQRHLETV